VLRATYPELKVVGFFLNLEERDDMGFGLFTSARGAMVDLDNSIIVFIHSPRLGTHI
jgi:hypothetical protein